MMPSDFVPAGSSMQQEEYYVKYIKNSNLLILVYQYIKKGLCLKRKVKFELIFCAYLGNDRAHVSVSNHLKFKSGYRTSVKWQKVIGCSEFHPFFGNLWADDL